MDNKYLNLIEFIKKVNTESLNTNEYRFYIITNYDEQEIEPIFDTNSEVYNFEIVGDGSDITTIYSLTEITTAKYKIERM